MPWLYLLLAAAAFAAAFKTTSVALMAFALLVGLALVLAWMLALLAARVDSRTGNAALLIDPVEVRRLREQAEARREALDRIPAETHASAAPPEAAIQPRN